MPTSRRTMRLLSMLKKRQMRATQPHRTRRSLLAIIFRQLQPGRLPQAKPSPPCHILRPMQDLMHTMTNTSRAMAGAGLTHICHHLRSRRPPSIPTPEAPLVPSINIPGAQRKKVGWSSGQPITAAISAVSISKGSPAKTFCPASEQFAISIALFQKCTSISFHCIYLAHRPVSVFAQQQKADSQASADLRD
jgi:hypothetical protein